MDWSELARGYISRVEVDTAYGPSFVFDDPFEPGPPNPYLEKLKPRVKLWIAGHPTVIEPYGAPGPTKWPLIRAAVIASGILAATGAGLWLTRKL